MALSHQNARDSVVEQMQKTALWSRIQHLLSNKDHQDAFRKPRRGDLEGKNSLPIVALQQLDFNTQLPLEVKILIGCHGIHLMLDSDAGEWQEDAGI